MVVNSNHNTFNLIPIKLEMVAQDRIQNVIVDYISLSLFLLQVLRVKQGDVFCVVGIMAENKDGKPNVIILGGE